MASRPGSAAWRQAGIDAVNLHRREWTAARVDAVHAAGLWAFGVGRPDAAPEITRAAGLAGSTGCTPITSTC